MIEPPRRSPTAARLLPVAGLLAVWGWFLWTGLRGIDFGRHWDDAGLLAQVRESLQKGRLLPGIYNYPGVTYWLITLCALPGTPREWLTGHEGVPLAPGPLPSTLIDPEDEAGGDRLPAGWPLSTRQDLLRVRTVFLLFASLAVPAAYALARAWGLSRAFALIAAALAGLSGELAYHSRWVAPDAILVPPVTAALALLTLAWRRPERPACLTGAAALVALAMGTKYTAGFLVLPLAAVLARALVRRPRAPGPVLLGAVLALCGTFLLTTPGALLEPGLLLSAIVHESAHYAAGHVGHTVPAGLPHLLLNLRYLGLALPSPWIPVAVGFSLTAVVGLVLLVRDRPGLAAILLGSFAFLLMFMSWQRAMLPRNLLPWAALFALAFARGASGLVALARFRPVQALVLALVTAALVAHAAWLGVAARTIRTDHASRYAKAFLRDVAEKGPSTYAVSAGLARHLESLVGADGVRELRHGATKGVRRNAVLASELAAAHCEAWVPPGQPMTVYGPLEVNLRYYPIWIGRERIVVLDRKLVKKLYPGLLQR
jgi:4-amino-4-deoxy-L-arabinose transferase-like glycosyltransferase